MYAEVNFKTKKQLKEAVAAGRKIGVYQPNDMFGKTEQVLRESRTAAVSVTLEGPHYPQPHRWYATAKISNGIIVEVR